MDYRDFEGTIPSGQYGAGSVIVWDRGTYTLAEGDDPATEIAAGKIKFVMHGEKLHGEFTLVKIKPREGESGDPWLLIKDRDEHVDPFVAFEHVAPEPSRLFRRAVRVEIERFSAAFSAAMSSTWIHRS